MSKTEQNLWEAFAGESQANRKYLAFSKKADDEGYPQAAKLFRAAAAAETVHAHSHFRVLKAVKSTAENIQDAIAGETHEFKTMYPGMIKEAKSEGLTAAEGTFAFANEVEKIHANLYQNALDNLNSPKEVDCYYVCSICGNTCENEPPETGPICGAKAKALLKTD